MKESDRVPLPSGFIDRARTQMGPESEAFLHALDEPIRTSVLMNGMKPSGTFSHEPAVAWNHFGHILNERPVFTMDPLWHAGAYYVQESSSMFIGWIMDSLFNGRRDLICLDLCAAPGGKSLNVLNYLKGDGLLISNEPVPMRNAMLRENITKWGMPNVMVTRAQTRQMKPLSGLFDVVLVDAPCSGEGMFRKDDFARTQWSESLVQQCSKEQEDILEQAWELVRPGGYIVYSTCTFSPEENEQRMEQLCMYPDAESVRLSPEPDWRVREVSSGRGWLYRFMPHLHPGEGLTIGVVKKTGSVAVHRQKRASVLRTPDTAVWGKWIENAADMVSHTTSSGDVYFLPSDGAITQVAEICLKELTVTLPGLHAGTLKGKDVVPGHALAVSTCLSTQLPRIALTKEDAIRYLRCEGIQAPADIRGWAAVTWNAHVLGWVKSIPPRVNNYYPREWKIRMQGV